MNIHFVVQTSNLNFFSCIKNSAARAVDVSIVSEDFLQILLESDESNSSSPLNKRKKNDGNNDSSEYL